MGSDAFSEALNRAAERNLPVMELLAVAGRLQAENQPRLAEALYRTWIEHNSDDRLIHAIYFNMGVLLSGVRDLVGAKNAFEAAIRVNPDFYPPYINLGGVLDRLGAVGDAVTIWSTLSNRLPAITGENINYKTSALKQIGRVLERANYDPHAEDALRQSLEIYPHQNDVVQHYVSLRQRQCKWPVIKPWANVERKTLLGGISALSLAAYTDDPFLQLGNAYMYCRHNIGDPSITFVDTHAKHRAAPRSGRRRIGYLSSDLREHAIGFLTAELYELHDRSKVEVFLYYCGIPSKDEIHNRIKASAEHWFDLGDMSDEDAARRIVDDGIEILVDVNGYTNGQRTKMLAMRPAPVIVNWLGFPGSVGTPYHDYIVADEFIIPKSAELFYAEKVLRLPCYQPNDRKRAISPNRPTRAEAGLPEDAMVYCCFNGVHKITPFTWQRWMTILAQVPNSVLWLLDTIETTNGRLRELAQAAGVAPERIIFAPKRRNPDHLARYPLADLFLDTIPYGAHTTSSDALWMGVPVLTWPGRCFASRVCGSLVTAAGLPELVCDTPESYVARAIEIGRDPNIRGALRRKLADQRESCVLFDTPLLARSLEGLYDQMWQEFQAGTIPRPNLANLDVYNAVGIDLDRSDVEMTLVPNYLDLYREKLTARSAYTYLAPDGRLWPVR